MDGTGVQLTTNSRWGDYTSMNIDPTDDCTFWYVNEYYTAAGQASSPPAGRRGSGASRSRAARTRSPRLAQSIVAAHTGPARGALLAPAIVGLRGWAVSGR